MSKHQTDITLSLSFEHEKTEVKAADIIERIFELINDEYHEDRLDVVFVDNSFVIENSVCIENEPQDDTYNDS